MRRNESDSGGTSCEAECRGRVFAEIHDLRLMMFVEGRWSVVGSVQMQSSASARLAQAACG